LLLLKCVNVNIYKKSLKLVRYAYIYIYIYLYFFIHVVADVDDFFVLSFSQSRLVVFCSRFIIMSCLTIIVFVAFPESLYCTVLRCLRSQHNCMPGVPCGR
jgi:hypothetical protein